MKDMKVSRIVAECFQRSQGTPLPIHTYQLGNKKFDDNLLLDVMEAINQKDRDAQEEAITIIKLNKCLLNDKLVRSLSHINTPNQLKLILYRNSITKFGCSSLTTCNWINRLICLNLDNNNISDKGCLPLSKGEFSQLKQLRLGDCQIGDQGCFHLGNIKVRKIKILSLQWNVIGKKGCKGLSLGYWPSLQEISLKGNIIEDKGAAYISKALWGETKTVNLYKAIIGDRGCAWLSKTFKRLDYLHLGGNQISEKGCEHLCKHEERQLREIDLSNLELSRGEYNRIGIIGNMCLDQKIHFVRND